METKNYDSLGLSWPLSVPTSTAEYDSMAKKDGACLRDAIQQTVYHSTLGEIRARFAEELDKELTKRNEQLKADGKDLIDIAWESGRLDKDKEPILLNEGAWVAKVLANTNTKIEDWAFLQSRVLDDQTITKSDGTSEVIKGVSFDPSAQERKGGPPKLSAASKNAADALIKKHGDKSAIIAKKLEALNPEQTKKAEYEENGTPKRDYLARLITAEEARKRALVKLDDVYGALAE